MQDVLEIAAHLNRPKLLVRAAKSALGQYRREIHLARVLPGHKVKKHSEAILLLMELEADFEDRRRCKGAGYCLADHIDVLIALVGEVQLLQARIKLLTSAPRGIRVDARMKI